MHAFLFDHIAQLGYSLELNIDKKKTALENQFSLNIKKFRNSYIFKFNVDFMVFLILS